MFKMEVEIVKGGVLKPFDLESSAYTVTSGMRSFINMKYIV